MMDRRAAIYGLVSVIGSPAGSLAWPFGVSAQEPEIPLIGISSAVHRFAMQLCNRLSFTMGRSRGWRTRYGITLTCSRPHGPTSRCSQVSTKI